MKDYSVSKPIEVLLVEDDLADVDLTQEALHESKLLLNINTVEDGFKALAYLRCEAPYTAARRPDLILLDLNMPRKNGREVLREIKADDRLKCIPVVVLTTSQAEEDIIESYNLGANCYITKPVGLREFEKVVLCIEAFWFTVVTLPTRETHV